MYVHFFYKCLFFNSCSQMIYNSFPVLCNTLFQSSSGYWWSTSKSAALNLSMSVFITDSTEARSNAASKHSTRLNFPHVNTYDAFAIKAPFDIPRQLRERDKACQFLCGYFYQFPVDTFSTVSQNHFFFIDIFRSRDLYLLRVKR